MGLTKTYIQGVAGMPGADGAPGAAGAPGSVWRSDHGVPSNSLGINGDYYLDVDTDNVYQKASNAYSFACNIKGSTGAAGAKGDTGSAGQQGIQGVKGDTGAQGPQGVQGPAGAAGSNGTNGTNGTNGASVVWRGAYAGGTTYAALDAVSYLGSSYICIAATTGHDPTNGTYWSPMAAKGDTGASGSTGAQGIQGIQGPAGSNGSNGTNGTNGATWFATAVNGTPSAGTGTDGDLYLDTATDNVYKRVTGAWVLQCNIKGSTGAQGAQGIQGIQGIQGNTGATGSAGPNTVTTSTTTNITGLIKGTGSAIAAASSNVDYLNPSIGTTKGDLIVFTGSGTPVRLGTGGSANNGQVLTIDDSQTNGIKWAAAAGGGGSGPPVYTTAGTIASPKTSAYSASIGEVVFCNPTGGAFTVKLPACSGNGGKVVRIVNVSSSTNLITVQRADSPGTELINGAATFTEMVYGYQSQEFFCDGAGWVVF